MEERNSFTIRQRGSEIHGYKSHDKNDFSFDEDIVGLDTNILVDMVESEDLKNEVKMHTQFNVFGIYSTNVAFAEARNVLVKKKNHDWEKATNYLNNLIKEFKITLVKHNSEFNDIAQEWFDKVKSKMFIKNIRTFLSDCRIISNLFNQVKMNFYITEDQDLEKAVKILNLPIRVKIIGEASNISGRKIKDFFKENRKFRHR